MTENNRKQSIMEIARYGIAGLTTTLVNIGFYHVLALLGMDYRAANLIAIVCSKVYGYIVNKLFVFRSNCGTRKGLIQEIGKFIGTRGITGIVDYAGLIFMVEVCSFGNMVSKYVVTAIVIILNYVLGKFMVFKRKSDRK